MRIAVSVLVTALICAATAGAEEAKAKKAKPELKGDLAQLQGKWQVVEFLDRGQPRPEFCKIVRFAIADATLTLTMPSLDVPPPGSPKSTDSFDVKLAIDESASPKHFDLTAVEVTKTTTVPGLYALDGDRLRVCWPQKSDDPRPARLKSDDENNTVLLILERIKK